MAVPGRVAVDASAARGAGRLRANLATYPAKARDSRWAADRDFLSALAEPKRLFSTAPRHVREWYRAQRPRDAGRKAAHQTVLWVVQAWRVVLLQADDWELLQALAWRVRQALRPAAPLQVQEQAPWTPLRALPVRLALPLAQREPQARSVSMPLAAHFLVELPQAQPVSAVRPSQLLPSRLFLLWPPLPLALRLPRLPESSCAPSQRRPRGSSSSASSSP